MRHIIIVIVVIIVIFMIEYFVHQNKFSHYVNYLKYTKLNDNISLEDSNIYIGKNPTDECIYQDQEDKAKCSKVPRISSDNYKISFEKLVCSDTNSAKDCLDNKKCKIVHIPDINNPTQDTPYCRSDNDVNVESDLIVDDYLLLGDTQDHQVKVDINLIRKIKNLPYHFDKTGPINNEEETICLVNGPVDLPRCVEDDTGKYYIKTKGGDETIDSGYDQSKDCKYKINNNNPVADTFGSYSAPRNALPFIEHSKFRTLKHCKKYLENNYQDIKNNTNTDDQIRDMCPALDSQYHKENDDRISCIQKHHLEMLDGERPISLRSFGNVYPFTFFQEKYNGLPRIKRGMNDNEDIKLPGSGQGPKSVNVKRHYELKVYSKPNYTGSSKTIRFPGNKNLGNSFPNGIRSYRTKTLADKDQTNNICLSKYALSLPPRYNATPNKNSMFTVKPCSYDNADQLFYIDFANSTNITGEHEHPHIHNKNHIH